MTTRTKSEPETTLAIGTSAPWLELVLISNFNANRTERVVHLSQSEDLLKRAIVTLTPKSGFDWRTTDDGYTLAVLSVDRSKRYVIRPAKPGFVLE